MEDAKLLDKVIDRLLEYLEENPIDSEEYKSAVEYFTKLQDRKNERDKIRGEQRDRMQTRENENALKIKQMHDDRIDRLIGHILTGIGIAVTAGVSIWGVLRCLKFEEEGTVTTSVGRALIPKLFSKK